MIYFSKLPYDFRQSREYVAGQSFPASETVPNIDNMMLCILELQQNLREVASTLDVVISENNRLTVELQEIKNRFS